jgi:hypothetical protein
MSRSSGRKGLTPEIKRVLQSFMSSMRVSRSVILRGKMVRVPFRHTATLPPLPSFLPLLSSGAVSAIHRLPPCTVLCRSIGRLEALAKMSSGSELRGLGMEPQTFPSLCPPPCLLDPRPSLPPSPLPPRCPAPAPASPTRNVRISLLPSEHDSNV